MKKVLLISFVILFSSFAFSQTLVLENILGQDISNTSISVDVKSSDEAVLECVLKNNSSSIIEVTLTKKDNIPDGAESSYCALGACVPPTTNSSTGNIEGNDKDEETYHYKPKGTTTDATVVYTFSYDGGNDITYTINYHVIDDTKITSHSKDNDFIAYPNPANSKVNISFNITENAKVVIYNIVGKKVKEYAISPALENIELETSSLQAGTYFYSIISNKKLFGTKRLVIKH